MFTSGGSFANEVALFTSLVRPVGVQLSLLSRLDKSLQQASCGFSTGGTKQIDPLV